MLCFISGKNYNSPEWNFRSGHVWVLCTRKRQEAVYTHWSVYYVTLWLHDIISILYVFIFFLSFYFAPWLYSSIVDYALTANTFWIIYCKYSINQFQVSVWHWGVFFILLASGCAIVIWSSMDQTSGKRKAFGINYVFTEFRNECYGCFERFLNLISQVW